MEPFRPRLISSVFMPPFPIFQNSAQKISIQKMKRFFQGLPEVSEGVAPQRVWEFSHHIHVKSKARPKPFTGTGDDVITMLCWSLMGGQRWSERNSSLAMTQQPFGRRSADLKSGPKLPIFSDAGYAGSSGICIICWHHFQFWKSLTRWHRRRWRRRGKNGES